VAVFGVTDGLLPHRLTEDDEEERRVLHVAITRGRHRVLVLGDRSRRSPFLDELDGSAPVAPPVLSAGGEPVVSSGRQRAGGRDAAARSAGTPSPRRTGRESGPAGQRPVGEPAKVGRVSAALRAWRTERARADQMPPYIILNDKHLDGIAEALPTDLAQLRACPGIGPAKLESYGDEILALVARSQEE
jgi:DNA helicase-2/ATP-dependent DNA helicase PcrA